MSQHQSTGKKNITFDEGVIGAIAGMGTSKLILLQHAIAPSVSATVKEALRMQTPEQSKADCDRHLEICRQKIQDRMILGANIVRELKGKEPISRSDIED